VINCTLQLLYPQERTPNPINKRLGGPQRRSGYFLKENNVGPTVI